MGKVVMSEEKITAIGELKARIERSRERLRGEEYAVPKVFEFVRGWPGDWQGRTLLALCEHYEASNRTDARVLRQIDAIIYALPENTNRYGYFGEEFDGVTANEQQISGNSWFIRGLCDYFRITGCKDTLKRLNTIAEKFLIPLKPFYEKYPIIEREEGGVDGHIVGNKNADGWLLSSDVGCAFIMLDGITDLYDITGNENVRDAIDVMINRFLSFDVAAVKFQTHATLSASRGIMRMFKLTNNNRYLAAAEKMFKIYAREGTTVNYANFNWFRKPLTWTEPCAFIDSLILAVELYKATGNYFYAQFANRVYFNAFRTAQRRNGGAGCETCLGEQNNELKVSKYEAMFCCTMRMANGLNYLRANSFAKINGINMALFTVGGEYESSDCKFVYEFDWLHSCIKVTVMRGETDLKLYMPKGVTVAGATNKNGFVEFRLERGEYIFKLEINLQKENHNGREVYFYSDMLLTQKMYESAPDVRFSIGGRELSPIDDCITIEEKFGIDNYIQKI